MKNRKKITIIVGLTSLTFLIIHVINKFIFFLSTLKESLYSENSNYYNWRFGKIFYTKKGNGSPVLLIHDIDNSSSEYEWKELVNHLSSNHMVYTIDLLGCGRSDKPNMTYTNYLYVQLISDFIKNIIKHKVDVVTTGKSSSFVVMACFSDNLIINNIILINPTDIAELGKYPKKRNKLTKYIIDSPILGTLFYNIIANKNSIRKSFYSSYYYNKYKIKKKHIEAYHESAHIGGAKSKYIYSSMKCHYTNINIIHAIKELNNSIYIISGEHEPNCLDIQASYLNYNSAIEIQTIKETKHLPQLESPKKTGEIIELFLNI